MRRAFSPQIDALEARLPLSTPAVPDLDPGSFMIAPITPEQLYPPCDPVPYPTPGALLITIVPPGLPDPPPPTVINPDPVPSPGGTLSP